MLDSTFVEAIVGSATQEAKLIDTGFRKKVLVAYHPGGGVVQTEFNDPSAPEPKALMLATLAGIVDLITAALITAPVVVQVNGPDCVSVVSPFFGDLRQNLVFAKAIPTLPSLALGQSLPLEQFMVMLQTCFVATEDRANLLKVVGGVRASRTTEVKDDGTSQSAAVATGVTRIETVEVPPQWMLAAFRTFPEIEQPTLPFLLRFRQNEGDKGNPITAGLFEADGGAWRMLASADIAKWLRENLPEGATVLA